mgnify:CR=1 FL=1
MAGLAIWFIVCIVGGGICAIAGTIASWVKGNGEVRPQAPTQQVEVHVHQYEQFQNPTIAEQFDGRLTNILKNPLEGIL